MRVGHVSEAWRYPVKSFAGEQVDAAELDRVGIIGDRQWSMIDASGDVAWAKRFPKLLDLAAGYVGSSPQSRAYGKAVPPVSIRFPDGRVLDSRDGVDAAVSDYAGASLRLCPLEPPENREHYRWSAPPDEEAMRSVFGLGDDEPMPDLSIYDMDLVATLMEHYSPPGTYFDMAPVHLITTASLAHMEAASGVAFSARRFRPNFIVDTVPEISGLVEFDWVGKTLAIGDVRLKVQFKTVRCSMPARGQAPYGLEPAPQVAKSLYQETGRFLGSYLSIQKPGKVRTGDEVLLLDSD